MYQGVILFADVSEVNISNCQISELSLTNVIN